MSEYADAIEKAIETEQARWQERLDKVISRIYPERDGGGCDSGDPLDFTEAELGQAIGHLTDRITALEAVAGYARHKESCHLIKFANNHDVSECNCTCGLDAALKAAGIGGKNGL